MSDKKKGQGAAMPMHLNTAALPKVGDKMTAHIFTDPLCGDCWGVEPQIRRLELEYGDSFHTIYHFTGLLPEGGKAPQGMAEKWDKQAGVYGMPMHGQMWRENAPSSSHPACMAGKVAFLQGFINGERYLRLVREFALLEGKNIADKAVLKEAAEQAGLDVAKFEKDYAEKGRVLLDEDMRLAKEVGISFIPTVIIKDGAKAAVVDEVRDYPVYEAALKSVSPDAAKKDLPDEVEELFQRYHSLTIREIDELTRNMSTVRASSEASNLVTKRKARRITYPGGFLWRKLETK